MGWWCRFMKYIQHPTTVRMLIEEIKRACDDYTSRKITGVELKSLIITWANTSGDKLFDGPSNFNPTVIQRVGKKRLKLIEVMLKGFQASML